MKLCSDHGVVLTWLPLGPLPVKRILSGLIIISLLVLICENLEIIFKEDARQIE